MDRDLLRRIVRVEASFGEGIEPKTGTGIRLRPGLVLTAQHVVEHRDAGQVQPATEVLVLLDRDGDSEPQIAPATVVWRGEERLDPHDLRHLDAVLLEDQLPGDGLEPFDRWVPVTLSRRSEWETQGYATAGAGDAAAFDEYLSGLCMPAREKTTAIQLTCDRPPPETPRGQKLPWKGISGGPVFIRNGRYTGHLYGIVRSSPVAFTDEILAVGLPALLRDPDFRKQVRHRDPAPPHESLVEALRSLLEADPDLAERFARLDPEWWNCWSSEDIDGLVGLLAADQDLAAQLRKLRNLRGSFDTDARIDRLKELALLVAALGARHQIPGGVDLDVESLQRIEVGSASSCFAEAFLASAYGVPPEYEKVETGMPRAYLRIPTAALENGVRDASFFSDQMEEVVAFAMERDLGDTSFLLREQVTRLRKRPPKERAALLRKQIDSNFRQLSQIHGRPPYLLADPDFRSGVEEKLDRFLGRLEKALPSLQLVVLEDDYEALDRAIEQEEQLLPLWQILDLVDQPKRRNGPRGNSP